MSHWGQRASAELLNEHGRRGWFRDGPVRQPGGVAYLIFTGTK